MVNLSAGILSEILFLLEIDQQALKSEIEHHLFNFDSIGEILTQTLLSQFMMNIFILC